MSECPDTETPWGEVCRTCGHRLPAKRPFQSWRAQRIEAEPDRPRCGYMLRGGPCDRTEGHSDSTRHLTREQLVAYNATYNRSA